MRVLRVSVDEEEYRREKSTDLSISRPIVRRSRIREPSLEIELSPIGDREHPFLQLIWLDSANDANGEWNLEMGISRAILMRGRDPLKRRRLRSIPQG
ncbi:hypothetical protein GH714_026155 [Hevea brasiliensis]|uniref:Uncharacterized protein n=1 Tax=Hevea brasiliensis TaxID=3981 RepID=A0A6A6M3V0_HEVBR|nr:hypothetical protein GH714_026155 [Hevea brasiliensis]